MLSLFFSILLTRFSWAIDMPYLDRAKIRLAIARGSQEHGEIIVKNPGPEARAMRLYLEDWFYAPGGDGAKSFIPAGTASRSSSSWVSFSPGEFTVPPNSEQRVSYQVKVPEDNNLVGGYYAVLFFESRVGELARQEQEAGAGLNLVIRVGALFYIEVKGTVSRAAVIENLALRKESSPNRLLVEADCRNTGNVDITAGGTFHIIDQKGVVYARSEFNTVYTFPGDSVKLNASWNTWKNPIPKGRYDIVLTIDLGKALSEAGLGRGPMVTKEAEIEVGDMGEILKAGALK
ncbi:MAG: hypothetical protein A3G37_03660 [Omnitrophica WOR_2 bacterium RIFCSPLOWO2_12_FULL_46_30]|nr:MAG: hypothetical protein A3H41_03415 [Omnitrophica WOR_2 bacterium RIFCSPLOWO2_02_FULL_45_28]OGX50152.1 MAG: hypothetical protein A3G37_03660 [Omnitrophica WOR_2 bacterium RIFCSPLOWO2_12_FULL_46_30]